MNDVKSLVESRAFWSALLSLVALVATNFHVTQFAAWAGDPASLDGIMQAVAMLGALGAIVFRYTATARTTTILPGSSGGGSGGAGAALALIVALPALGALGACSQAQLTSYTGAINATGAVLKQVGSDLVAIDCQSASLISVVARDAGAASRVQAALARNAQIARDACPALTGAPAVQVTAGA